jgi:hypothetical protein
MSVSSRGRRAVISRGLTYSGDRRRLRHPLATPWAMSEGIGPVPPYSTPSRQPDATQHGTLMDAVPVSNGASTPCAGY